MSKVRSATETALGGRRQAWAKGCESEPLCLLVLFTVATERHQSHQTEPKPIENTLSTWEYLLRGVSASLEVSKSLSKTPER